MLTIKIFKNELRLFLKNTSAFLSLCFVGFLLIFIVNLCLRHVFGNKEATLFPLIWLALFFGGLMRIQRSFEPESEGDLLNYFQMRPHTLKPLFMAKNLMNIICLLIYALFIEAFVVVLFNLSLSFYSYLWVCLLSLGGIVGLSTLGTFFAVLTREHMQKDLLLPLILYPLLAPVLIASVQSAELIGGDIIFNGVWIRFLILVDLIYLVFCYGLFGSQLLE